MIRLALAALCVALPAYAQACAPLDQVAEQLHRVGEAPVADAIDSNGHLLLVWVNPETQTWTITVTLPTGLTCLVGAGVEYTPVRGEPNV